MAAGGTVWEGWLRALDALEAALDDPNAQRAGHDGLMKQWGALLVETSQRSFVDQRLGDIQWPSRYEGMEDPFINIAGALSDFNDGRTNPQPSRFDRRPALVGPAGFGGGLNASISFSIPGPLEVEEGSNKPYAQVHQEGGKTRINISESGYQRGRDWLVTKKGEPRKGREGYFPKLWPSLYRRSHEQNVMRRPYLGVPEETADNLIRATVEYFEDGQAEGSGAPAPIR